MKSLQEQIAGFKAKGCMAGGRKWVVETKGADNYTYYAIGTFFNDYRMVVYSKLIVGTYNFTFSSGITLFFGDLTCTTLEEALLEALEIVKAKVMDLAKELGLITFTVAEIDILRKGGTEERFEMFKSKQYIEEQCNEKIS